jgi:hypothetical protein
MESTDQAFFTTNTKLAVALATIGCSLRPQDPVTRVTYHHDAAQLQREVTELAQQATRATADGNHRAAAELRMRHDDAAARLAVNGKTVVTYYFEPQADTVSGTIATDRAALEFEGKPQLLPPAIKDALSLLRVALDNRDRLIDLVHNRAPELLSVQRGGKTLLISKTAPAHVRERMQKELNS